MKKSLRVYLKAGEKLFVNGAVLRVDRKVSIEFLNDVKFLLEGHVLQPEQTTTPLRQLYFTVQTMLIDTENTEDARSMHTELHTALMATLENSTIRTGLVEASRLAESGRLYDSLKAIRALFPQEHEILSRHIPEREQKGVLEACK
jgi:flagellar biosynthesis repressor protein FlbT